MHSTKSESAKAIRYARTTKHAYKPGNLLRTCGFPRSSCRRCSRRRPARSEHVMLTPVLSDVAPSGQRVAHAPASLNTNVTLPVARSSLSLSTLYPASNGKWAPP